MGSTVLRAGRGSFMKKKCNGKFVQSVFYTAHLHVRSVI